MSRTKSRTIQYLLLFGLVFSAFSTYSDYAKAEANTNINENMLNAIGQYIGAVDAHIDYADKHLDRNNEEWKDYTSNANTLLKKNIPLKELRDRWDLAKKISAFLAIIFNICALLLSFRSTDENI